MPLPIPENKFTHFLCSAKKATYAAGEGAAQVTPSIKGSQQLEFLQGSFLYRDIYFGGNFFVGQETVYYLDQPVWAMSYAGGVAIGLNTANNSRIYQFLRTALRAVPESAPFRGPETFRNGDFLYQNRILGVVGRFSGVETIQNKGIQVYKLHYHGGYLLD